MSCGWAPKAGLSQTKKLRDKTRCVQHKPKAAEEIEKGKRELGKRKKRKKGKKGRKLAHLGSIRVWLSRNLDVIGVVSSLVGDDRLIHHRTIPWIPNRCVVVVELRHNVKQPF